MKLTPESDALLDAVLPAMLAVTFDDPITTAERGKMRAGLEARLAAVEKRVRAESVKQIVGWLYTEAWIDEAEHSLLIEVLSPKDAADLTTTPTEPREDQ